MGGNNKLKEGWYFKSAGLPFVSFYMHQSYIEERLDLV